MARDPRIAQLAIALVKHRITGDNTATTALLNDLDVGDLRRVLLEQTDNTVRVFKDAMRDQVADLAKRLGMDTEQVIANLITKHLDTLILGLAAKETEGE